MLAAGLIGVFFRFVIELWRHDDGYKAASQIRLHLDPCDCPQRVLIATHTTHLQEQLLNKDIPLAAAILGLPGLRPS